MAEVGSLVAVAILVVVVVTLFKGVKIVPQGEEWVIERLGKYHQILYPGLRLIIPYFDRVAYRLTTKDQLLDIDEQEVITKDNAVILANAIAFIKVTEPVKAVYGVTNYALAIRNLVMTTLRSIIGEMELDEALSSREKIKARLKGDIADEAIDWGLTIRSVEIQDIKPTGSMQRAMEQQASAERERKAMVTLAEGERQSVILAADGRQEAAKRDAEAQVTLARASSQAIQLVSEAISDREGPMAFILGEKYIKAMRELSASENAKFVVLPADLPDAIRGLIRRAS
jgi:regulator of protease activity HflC (stomatin/prohibitin superfamily)